VVRVDREPAIVVEPVGVEALVARCRVQVQLTAFQPSTLLEEPVEQRSAVAVAPCIGRRGEVIDVQITSPRKAVADPKAGDGDGLLTVWEDGTDQSVAGGAQDPVDMLGELPLARPRRAQRTHRLVRAMGFACLELAYLDRVVGNVHTAKEATSRRGSRRRSSRQWGKTAARSGWVRKLGGPVDPRKAIRIVLPCTIALACAGVVVGCGSSSTSGSPNAEQSGEAAAAQRAEEAVHKREEAEETNKNRELLSQVEATKREESAEQAAKKAEASAEARAKKRERTAAAEAKKKLHAAEAKAKTNEEATKADLKRKEEASKKSTQVKAKSPAKPEVKTQTSQAIPLKVTE
jgi:hypothetical protein